MRDRKVSLYIPCYNASGTLAECLDAVLAQTYPLEEILVVNDGSTDKSGRVLKGYPVRRISWAKNRGLAHVRNTAVKNLKSELIASLDADCIAHPRWLELLIERMDNQDIAGAGGELSDPDYSSLFDLWRSVHMKQRWGEPGAEPPFLFGSNAVFRRERLIESGLYDERYRNNYEDVDICQRLKAAGYRLIYEPKAKARHLKQDDLCSLLDTHWKWDFAYYAQAGFYSDEGRLISKAGENIGLANRYLEEDIREGRYLLLYLDFLLGLHHSFRDLEYFLSQNGRDKGRRAAADKYALLADLSVLGSMLSESGGADFKNEKFSDMLYKHLCLALYKIKGPALAKGLQGYRGLGRARIKPSMREQPAINRRFMKELVSGLMQRISNLILRFPNLVNILEKGAEKTEDAVLSCERRPIEMKSHNMPTTTVLLIFSWLIALAGISGAAYQLIFNFNRSSSLIQGSFILFASLLLAALVRMLANIGQLARNMEEELRSVRIYLKEVKSSLLK